MEDLQNRVKALEVGEKFDASQAAVKKVQMECLEMLREIRASLEQSSCGGAGATISASVSSKELDALKAENASLKVKIAKQDYRIEHLVNAVEELLATRDASK